MSCTRLAGAIDLDMWRRLLNMETPYQSAEDLCRDAVDGGWAQFVVIFCLQLRINPKTRRLNPLNNFEEGREDQRHKLRLWRLMPPIFMLTVAFLCSVVRMLLVQACLKTHQGLANGSEFSLPPAVCCQAIRRLWRPGQKVLQMLQHKGGTTFCMGR